MDLAVLLSCEHGGNRVPRSYAHLFASRRARTALSSHRGHDPGALAVAAALSRRLGAPLIAATTTRLLVELNRSVGHHGLFSEFSAKLDAGARRALLERHYEPHRERVEDAVNELAPVCHIAVHSFTPVFDGEHRRADIGLLYDSRRPLERALCMRWQNILAQLAPELRVRRNYPYLGKADGLTTALRRHHAPARYLGIELEMNQALLTGPKSRRTRLIATLTASLTALLNDQSCRPPAGSSRAC